MGGGEHEPHRLGCVLDRRDLLEDLFEAGLLTRALPGPGLGAYEPAEAVGLESEKIGNLKGLVNLGERHPVYDRLAFESGERIGARSSQRGFLP